MTEGSEAHSETIPSDLNEARRIEERMLDDIVACGFDEADVFATKLSLEEAFVNAIRHGNKMSPDKSVKVSWQATPAEARFTIEDEGDGFDYNDLPDPTLDENLELPSGRGVMLMRAYMDDVLFNERGNRVCLIKRRVP